MNAKICNIKFGAVQTCAPPVASRPAYQSPIPKSFAFRRINLEHRQIDVLLVAILVQDKKCESDGAMLPALLHNETDVSETVDMIKKKSLPALHNDGDVTETLAMLKSVGSMLDAVAAIDTAKTSRPITLDAITPEISSSLTPVRRPTRLEPIAPLQAAGAAVRAAKRGSGR